MVMCTLSLVLLPGNSFQWQKFALLWAPELFPCLSHWLLTAMAHKD
jgi:hypothetical protein